MMPGRGCARRSRYTVTVLLAYSEPTTVRPPPPGDLTGQLGTLAVNSSNQLRTITTSRRRVGELLTMRNRSSFLPTTTTGNRRPQRAREAPQMKTLDSS